MTMNKPITWDDVYAHVTRDHYVERRASYDVRALAAFLTDTYPGLSLPDIDPDTLWDILEAHVTCLHSPTAGFVYVDLEELVTVARDRKVTCESCERIYVVNGDTGLWVHS